MVLKSQFEINSWHAISFDPRSHQPYEVGFQVQDTEVPPTPHCWNGYSWGPYIQEHPFCQHHIIFLRINEWKQRNVFKSFKRYINVIHVLIYALGIVFHFLWALRLCVWTQVCTGLWTWAHARGDRKRRSKNTVWPWSPNSLGRFSILAPGFLPRQWPYEANSTGLFKDCCHMEKKK